MLLLYLTVRDIFSQYMYTGNNGCNGSVTLALRNIGWASNILLPRDNEKNVCECVTVTVTKRLNQS